MQHQLCMWPRNCYWCTVQWWFKDFCKRDESLEDKGHSGRPFEVDKDPLRGPSKLILLQLCAKSLQLCPTLCDPVDGSHQAPPSLGFSRQEYWSGLPLPSPTTMWEIAKELNTDHSMIIWHLKQIGKVKMFDKWVPRELTTNLKNCRFEVSSSIILPNNNKPFLHRIMTCDEKWILYCNWRWTSSVVELRISSKALS